MLSSEACAVKAAPDTNHTHCGMPNHKPRHKPSHKPTLSYFLMFPRSREQTILNYFFISTQRVESMIGVVCVWVCDWVCDWVFYIVTGLCLGKKMTTRERCQSQRAAPMLEVCIVVPRSGPSNLQLCLGYCATPSLKPL